MNVLPKVPCFSLLAGDQRRVCHRSLECICTGWQSSSELLNALATGCQNDSVGRRFDMVCRADLNDRRLKSPGLAGNVSVQT